ncbi:MAG: MarR family transcriptional regulator [Rhodobacteraceae bacterium]|nr:MarR family transcriptional regulator [Paracoccaceae bacterium]
MKTENTHDSVAITVVDISRLLRKRFEAHLAEIDTGVTVAEARTIAFILRFSGLRQSSLAERMSVEPMTLVGYLDSLEKAGLIQRVTDPSDRRAKLVTLTEAAAPVADKIRQASKLLQDEILMNISEDRRNELTNLLFQIKDNLLGTVNCEGQK